MAIIEGPSSDMPTHKPGCVVVAVNSKRAVALTGGTQLTWGERVFGGYRIFYNVNVAAQAISFLLKSPSKQPAIEFDVGIQLTIRITDPARAVAQDISNPEMLLSASIKRVVGEQSQGFDIADVFSARQSITKALGSLTVDPAITVVEVAVEIKPDEAARALLRPVAEEQLVKTADAAQARIEDARRKHILELLDRPDSLLAQSIITKDDAFKEALDFKLQQLSENRVQQYNLLKIMIDNKVIEPHDLHERYGGLYGEMIDSILSGLTSSRDTKAITSQESGNPEKNSKSDG